MSSSLLFFSTSSIMFLGFIMTVNLLLRSSGPSKYLKSSRIAYILFDYSISFLTLSSSLGIRVMKSLSSTSFSMLVGFCSIVFDIYLNLSSKAAVLFFAFLAMIPSSYRAVCLYFIARCSIISLR